MAVVDQVQTIRNNFLPKEGNRFKTRLFLSRARSSQNSNLDDLRAIDPSFLKHHASNAAQMNELPENELPINWKEEKYIAEFQLFDYYQKSSKIKAARRHLTNIQNSLITQITSNEFDNIDLRAFFQLLKASKQLINKKNKHHIQQLLSHATNYLIDRINAQNNSSEQPNDCPYDPQHLLQYLIPFIANHCNRSTKKQLITKIIQTANVPISSISTYFGWLPFVSSKLDLIDNKLDSKRREFEHSKTFLQEQINTHRFNENDLYLSLEFVKLIKQFKNRRNKAEIQTILVGAINYLIETLQVEDYESTCNTYEMLEKLLPAALEYCDKSAQKTLIHSITQGLNINVPWTAKVGGWLPFVNSKISLIEAELQQKGLEVDIFSQSNAVIPSFDNNLHENPKIPAQNNQKRIAYHINCAILQVLNVSQNQNQIENDFLAIREAFLKKLLVCQQQNSIDNLVIEKLDNAELNTIQNALIKNITKDIQITLKKQRLDLYDQKTNKVSAKNTKKWFIKKFNFSSKSKIEKYLKENNYDIPYITHNYHTHLINKISLRACKYYLKLLKNPLADKTALEQARNLVTHLTLHQNLENFDATQITDATLSGYLNEFQHIKNHEVNLFSLWNKLNICKQYGQRYYAEGEILTELNIPDSRLKFLGIFHRNRRALIQKEFAKRGYELPTYNNNTDLVGKTQKTLFDYYKFLTNCFLTKQIALDEYKDRTEEINYLLHNLSINKNFDVIKKVQDPFLQKTVIEFKETERLAEIGAYLEIQQAFWFYINNPSEGCFNEKIQPLITFLKSIGGPEYIKKVYNRFFADDATSIDDTEARVINFHKFLIKKLMQVQHTDFGPELSIEQKTSTLSYYKKMFNRFGQSVNSPLAILKVPDCVRLAYSCENLLNQLPDEHPRKNELKERLYRRNNNLPFPSIDPDKNKDIFKYKTAFRHWKREQAIFKKYDAKIPDLINLEKQIRQILIQQNIQVKEQPLIYAVDSNIAAQKEKEANRDIKKVISIISKFFAFILTAGQAALLFTSVISLAPLFGPIGIFVVFAVILFTMKQNYSVFSDSIYLTMKQFFIRKDWFNGFTSPSGKLLMFIALGLATLVGVIMSTMVGMATTGMIGMATTTAIAASFAFPPLGIMVVSSLFAVITLLGYTSWVYRKLAAIIDGCCGALEKRFPEIVQNGWGIKGLVAGLSQGVRRLWHQLQMPGVYSARGGVWNAIKEKRRLKWDKFWVNPVEDSNPTQEAIRAKRAENVVKLIVRPLFIGAGLIIFIIASVIMIQSMHNAIVSFLTDPLKNPFFTLSLEAATWISVAAVICVAGISRAIFNFSNKKHSFTKVVDKSIDIITTCTLEIGKTFFKKGHISRRCNELGKAISQKASSINKFFTDTPHREEKIKVWKSDLVRKKGGFLDKIKIYSADKLHLLISSFTKDAPADLQVYDNPNNIGGLNTFDVRKNAVSAVYSMEVNYFDFQVIENDNPLVDIPLQQIRAAQKATSHSKILNITESTIPSEIPIEVDSELEDNLVNPPGALPSAEQEFDFHMPPLVNVDMADENVENNNPPPFQFTA